MVLWWGLTMALGACSKRDEAQGSRPQGQGSMVLAYREFVRAGMDDLELVVSFLGENGERQQWRGRMTLAKVRLATVKHPTSQQKAVHLRRWANVYIAELPALGEPRADDTVNSPLTGRRLLADRLGDAGWRHRLAAEGSDEELNRLLGEFDRVEAGLAAFYKNQKLRVGESWQVPATAMARWFGDEVKELAGDINVKVDRLETMQDQACTVLEVSLQITGKMTDPDGEVLDLALEGSGEIWRATGLGEDLKVFIKGKATLGAVRATRQIQMTVTGPLVITEERKLERRL